MFSKASCTQIVHVEAALGLADQAQVGVVHHHVQIGQLELGADGQLFDHELEVVVAGDGHHLALGVGGTHAEGRRDGPAEGAGLAAVDPVARLVHVQKLGGGDLRQADGADVAGVLAEGLVHLFVHALGLHGRGVEVGLALQAALALLAGGSPGAAAGQRARRLHLPGHGDELVEGRAGIRDDAVVGPEHPADLGGFDVDMHELAAIGVHLHRAGVAVGPAVADADHEVGGQHGRVAVAVGGLQPDHAGHQRVVVGDGTPAHQGGDHRHAGELGELLQAGRRIGIDHAATGHDQRAFGGVQHGHGLLGLGAGGRRLVQGQGRVGVDVELDLGHLHVKGQVDEHRAGAAGTHDVEGLLEHPGHQGRLTHRHRPLGHRLGDGFNVHRLEVFLVQAGAGGLAGDAQDGDGIRRGRVQAGDHVGAGRAGGADAHPQVAGPGPGEALGHVRRTLHVAGEDVLEATILPHRRVKGVDGGAGHAKNGLHAFPAHHRGGGIHCSHSGHLCLLVGLSDGSMRTA
jgi:hypothetical protein